MTMLALLLTLAATAAAMEQHWHPAVDNALLSQIRDKNPMGVMSVSNGAPVTYCEANCSLNEPLTQNTFLMDHMTQQAHEKTISRPAHPKGAGAFGYFEVTHDISHICKASFLSEMGKKTPAAVRFSPATTEKGGSDLERGARGFAVKFYTEEGNFDIPGLNLPVFFTKDPALFVKFVYSLRKNPSLYLVNPMGLWDIILQYPEAINMFLLVFGDAGIPANYRRMPGYSIHTHQVENEKGEQYFVRWHFTPYEGVKNLRSAEARNIGDPDYYTRDLYDSIKNRDFPRWNVSVQIVNEEELKIYGYGVFDVTRRLPKTFPLHPVGELVLNRNPTNYFAEIEQMAFCPANLVNGIHGAPDRLYRARRFAYRDSQLHRLGPNVDEIPVNCPLLDPTYNPDSSGGSGLYESGQKSGLIEIEEEDPYTFDQAAEYYAGLSSEEQARTIETILAMLSPATPSVKEGAVDLLTTVHPDLGSRVAQGLNAAKTS